MMPGRGRDKTPPVKGWRIFRGKSDEEKDISLVLAALMAVLMVSGCSAYGDPVTVKDRVNAAGVKTIAVDYRSTHVIVENGIQIS